MLTSSSNWWKKTDCEVVKIKDLYVYPIFKNGSHELMRQKDKLIINNDIKNLKNIVVILRDPTERFISGVIKLDIEISPSMLSKLNFLFNALFKISTLYEFVFM